jgi:hypothetical protein
VGDRITVSFTVENVAEAPFQLSSTFVGPAIPTTRTETSEKAARRGFSLVRLTPGPERQAGDTRVEKLRIRKYFVRVVLPRLDHAPTCKTWWSRGVRPHACAV